MNAPMAITDTVSAFIRFAGRILLLRRSDRVRSFRGRWHGVSGAVETDVMGQAWTEIAEETGLDRADLIPRAIGIPFTVPDERPGRVWRVNPVLLDWAGAEPPRITLNWENDSWRWVEPADVAGLDGVPKLAEALARVCDPRRMEAVLVADREHGAGYLAERLLDLAAALPRAEAAAAAARAAAAFPAMAPLKFLAAELARSEEAAAATVARLRDERRRGIERVIAGAVAALAGARTVATLSRSSTVLAVAAAVPGLRWLVSESLPGGEGREMAAEIGAARRPSANEAAGADAAASAAEVISDADLIALFAADPPDAVLLGADAVTPDGGVVNKTGSAALAAAAKSAGRPVLVAADPWKRLPAETGPTGAEADRAQPPSGGIFEPVPPELIDEIL